MENEQKHRALRDTIGDRDDVRFSVIYGNVVGSVDDMNQERDEPVIPMRE